MKTKTYLYHVSYSYQNEKGVNIADNYIKYGEPMDTQDMIERARRDLAIIKNCNANELVIISFKRIKNNR